MAGTGRPVADGRYGFSRIGWAREGHPPQLPRSCTTIAMRVAFGRPGVYQIVAPTNHFQVQQLAPQDVFEAWSGRDRIFKQFGVDPPESPWRDDVYGRFLDYRQPVVQQIHAMCVAHLSRDASFIQTAGPLPHESGGRRLLK
jgi:hypothetical protein